MRKFVVIVASTALALVLGACGNSGKAGASDPDAVRKAIKADEVQWNKDFHVNDVNRLASHYSDDAYFVAPGVAGADGSTAIRQVFANGTTDSAFNIQFASDKIDVSASGDMAYARGKFTERYTDSKTGKVMTDSGKYLTVYKKQDDGSWKAVEDFAAADPGSTKPVPPEKPATRAKMVSF